MRLINNSSDIDDDVKSAILESIFNRYNMNNVLLVHLGGSIAYGTFSTESDIDVVVVLIDHTCDYESLKVNGYDLFVFKYELFKMRMRFSSRVESYLKMTSDSFLNFQNTKLYLNNEKIKMYNNLKLLADSFEYYLFDYFSCSIDYYDCLLYVRYPETTKGRMYHIYRLLGLLRYYDKQKFFDFESLNDLEFYKMTRFKTGNKDFQNSCRTELEETLLDLKKLFYRLVYVEKRILIRGRKAVSLKDSI
jgi:predicted nucleotidyltransferase